MPEKLKHKFSLDIQLKDDTKSELVELDIREHSPAIGNTIVDLQLPASALIVLIHRAEKYIPPTGETVVEPHDHQLIMADTKETIEKVQQCFGIVP